MGCKFQAKKRCENYIRRTIMPRELKLYMSIYCRTRDPYRRRQYIFLCRKTGGNQKVGGVSKTLTPKKFSVERLARPDQDITIGKTIKAAMMQTAGCLSFWLDELYIKGRR